MKRISRGLVLSLLLASCSSIPRHASVDPCFDASSRSPSSVRCEAVFDLSRRESTEDLVRKTWAQQQWSESFNRTESDALWASLIGASKVAEARQLGIHPLEVIGDQSGARWAASRRFLDGIPVGEFALSQSLLRDLNRGLLSDFQAKSERFIDTSPEQADRFRLKTQFGKLFSRFKNMAGYYRRGAHVRTFFPEVFPEEAFQRLQSQKTELGLNFYEIPGSRPGRRWGFLRQVLAKDVPARMNELLRKTNFEIDQARQGLSERHELEIVADFARHYMAIDPFPAGSHATLQALVNRMLVEFGYPPSSLLPFRGHEIPTTAEVVQGLRTGIDQYAKMVGQTKRQKIATIADRGLGTKWGKSDYERYALARRKIQPREEGLLVQSASEVIRLGRQKKTFVLLDDGFLHDSNGIPYLIREENGALKVFPIADKTYVLYAMGGALNGRQGVKRDPSEVYKAAFETNMNALESLLRGEKTERDFEILPYELVKKANLENEYLIYDWQLPLLLESIRIKEDPVRDPYAVLVPVRGDAEVESRSGRTVFERAFLRNTAKVGVSDVIGQYELRELESLKMKSFLKKNRSLSASDREKALQEVDGARRKIHTAAREILRPFFEKVRSFSPEEIALLERHPEYFGIASFLRYSKLRYESFDEAARQLGDDRVVVMRATSGRLVKWLGFRSENDIRALIEAVPASESIVSFLKSVHTDLLRLRSSQPTDSVEIPSVIRKRIIDFAEKNRIANDLLLTIANRLFLSRYEFRGTTAEMEREFVTQFLHTGASRGGKAGLSTTVSPSLLFKVGGDADGAAASGASPLKYSKQSDARIFFMSLGVDDVDVAYSSLWRNQYEVYLRHGFGTLTSNLRIKEQVVDVSLLNPETEALSPAAKSLLEDLGNLPTGFKKEN